MPPKAILRTIQGIVGIHLLRSEVSEELVEEGRATGLHDVDEEETLRISFSRRTAAVELWRRRLRTRCGIASDLRVSHRARCLPVCARRKPSRRPPPARGMSRSGGGSEPRGPLPLQH